MKILQVSEVTEQIKSLLEMHFNQLFVEGEVGRATYHSSGHLYFTLKDERSVIKVVMFKNDQKKLPFTENRRKAPSFSSGDIRRQKS